MHLASFQPNTDAFNNCTTGSQSAFLTKSSSTTGYISSVISACLQCILDPDGCKKKLHFNCSIGWQKFIPTNVGDTFNTCKTGSQSAF